MPRIALPEGVSIHCAVDDFLWPWDRSTPVLMMHGFARNATFWNRWVPAIGESHRVYRPDLLGCGLSDQPPKGYRYTPGRTGGSNCSPDMGMGSICCSRSAAPASLWNFGKG